MGIDSICNKLFRTVGLLAVRLDLAKLRLKTPQKKTGSKNRIFD